MSVAQRKASEMFVAMSRRAVSSKFILWLARVSVKFGFASHLFRLKFMALKIQGTASNSSAAILTHS
jgi:hypothetical protein